MGTGRRACKERVGWSSARTVFFLFSLNLNNCPLPPAELQTNVLLRKKAKLHLFICNPPEGHLVFCCTGFLSTRPAHPRSYLFS